MSKQAKGEEMTPRELAEKIAHDFVCESGDLPWPEDGSDELSPQQQRAVDDLSDRIESALASERAKVERLREAATEAAEQFEYMLNLCSGYEWYVGSNSEMQSRTDELRTALKETAP